MSWFPNSVGFISSDQELSIQATILGSGDGFQDPRGDEATTEMAPPRALPGLFSGRQRFSSRPLFSFDVSLEAGETFKKVAGRCVVEERIAVGV